jgi:exonuclease III
MNRPKIDVIGLCETQWQGQDDYECDAIRVISSGGQASQRGVAVLLNSNVKKCVHSIEKHTDRLMKITIQAEPVNLVIIQVYMPKSDHDDNEIDEMYDHIEELLDDTKGTNIVILLGDWNAVVGEQEDTETAHGQGQRNERGSKLVDFCQRKGLFITNTCFQQDTHRRYTWTMAGKRGRYQIDYILAQKRYNNSVNNACTLPGADANTDHNLLAAKVQTWL